MSIIASLLTAGSSSHAETSENANGVATDFVSQGVVGSFTATSGVAPCTGAFAVNAQGSPNMTVAVSSGVAYVTATPASQGSQTFRVKNSASANVTIAANSSGSTKYDWIYISMSAANAANPAVAGDNVATLVASRSSSATTDDGTPPTYGYCVAVVTVANAAATIVNGNISDKRTACTVGAAASNSGWIGLGYTPTTVTALGNRSYSCVFNSVDLTGTVSNGMRLKLTRTAAAPTQCTDLESGSSQYYSKTSPSAMTFTDDFTVSAWVKLESYTGAIQTIASRYNGTSGWDFNVQPNGTIGLVGFNAGAANFSSVSSYQSVPLGKWVHITAQLDMSTFTATPTTSYIMLDGVDVPSTVARGGTNPTALVQAGDLQIGRANTTQYFDGKLAQVAIYNAKVTQATVKASMNQTFSGSETSLISAYSFNNSINDLSANANNLTANGAAVATNADSPFAQGATAGSLEYGIVTANAFSTNTTLTIQVPEGSAIPTSGGVSAVSYSSQKTPYGFPVQRGKWQIMMSNRTNPGKSAPVAGTWYNTEIGAPQISLPVGPWNTWYSLAFGGYKTAATAVEFQGTLSTTNNSETDTDLTVWTVMEGASGTMSARAHFFRQKVLDITATTIYYFNAKAVTASAGEVALYASTAQSPAFIVAELANL